MSNLEDVIKKINTKKEKDQFDKYITYARFPNFKNLTPNSEITFDFPLTLLVGKNGSGKSSILHALWGMPFGYSTSRFWFSTEIDPIVEGQELGNPRYIYSYYAKDINKLLTVRKIRTSKKQGYFEPSRPAKSDGMEDMPTSEDKHAAYRSNDRWNPVKRKVIYINSKCETGTFERFFYQSDIGNLKQRHELFTYEAKRLKIAIDRNLTSFKPGGSERISKNEIISTEALSHINKILDQNYTEARIIFHKFYDRAGAPSVIFKNKDRTYSDSVAGSGELSAVTTVLKILEAEEYDLILLDEPETSLHPDAQRKLINFLLEQIERKRIQVVISTHSPTIVGILPESAIKVLEKCHDGKVSITNKSNYHSAFHQIGHTDKNKITIASEDQLLNELVTVAANTRLTSAEKERFNFTINSVGVDETLKHHIPSWMINNQNIYFFADGDQSDHLKKFPVPENLTAEKIQALPSTLKEIGLLPSGLTTPDLLINYIKWIKERVKLIDCICPELVFIKTLQISNTSLLQSLEEKSNQECKSILIKNLNLIGHTDTSAPALNFIFRTMLIQNNEHHSISPHLDHIARILKEI